MHKRLGTITTALLCSAAFAGTAMAADLIIDAPAAPEAAATNWGQFYFEVYGGLTLESTATISFQSYPSYDADLDAGTAFGASLGLMTPIEGLAFELDIMKAGGGEYPDYAPEGQTTYSLMVNAEYSLPVGDTFEIYGAAGVGFINSVYTAYDGTTDYSGTGAGYQLAIGARAKVTDGVSVFGELKYQNSFQPIEITGESNAVYFVQYPTVNALVGLRFAF